MVVRNLPAACHQNFTIMKPTPDYLRGSAGLWLEPLEKNDPERVVRSFFDAFSIGRCRHLLWQMLTASPQDHISGRNFMPEEHTRFIAKVESLVEASYLILLRKSGGEREEKDYAEEKHGRADQAGEKAGGGEKILAATRAGSVSRELIDEIHAFFDATDPGSFKTTLFNILLAYAGRYYYNAGEPVEVVETLDRLVRLLAGVKRWAGALTTPAAGYNSESRGPEPFSLKFPDHSCINPVDVLTRFFEDAGYQNIENTIGSLRFFSLCRQSGIEDGAVIDTLKFYHDITSLVEACDCIRRAYAGG